MLEPLKVVKKFSKGLRNVTDLDFFIITPITANVYTFLSLVM